MDYRNNKHNDPWDEGVYGTGNTMPPKSHSGIIALLLILVIFLSGIISVLSFLNIRLFQQLSRQQEQLDAAPVSFSDLEEATQIPESTGDPDHRPGKTDVTLNLKKSPQSVENFPQEGALPLQDIYEKNIPSVVSILSATSQGGITGSGIVVSGEGYIVTTCQAVEGAETITVTLHDGRSYSALIIGADALSDLAVLYVDAEKLQSAEFGDSNALRVGDPVTAIGDAAGSDLSGALTTGIISGIHQDVLLNGQSISLIRTNAAAGNSGGPLINCYGQIIGIHTTNFSAFANVEDTQGTSFALPSTTLKQIVDQLISQGYVSGRPTLGITGDGITQFDQHYFHIPPGLYISHVEPGTDAYRQGLEPGDILISIDDQPIQTQRALDELVWGHTIGDRVTAVVFRDGQEQTLSLILTEYDG